MQCSTNYHKNIFCCLVDQSIPETTTDDDKRPTRNRPKKIPDDFVMTPTRQRRRKPSKDVIQEEELQEDSTELKVTNEKKDTITRIENELQLDQEKEELSASDKIEESDQNVVTTSIESINDEVQIESGKLLLLFFLN